MFFVYGYGFKSKRLVNKDEYQKLMQSGVWFNTARERDASLIINNDSMQVEPKIKKTKNKIIAKIESGSEE